MNITYKYEYWVVAMDHDPDFHNLYKQKEAERRGISRALAWSKATEAGGIAKEAGPMRHEAVGGAGRWSGEKVGWMEKYLEEAGWLGR